MPLKPAVASLAPSLIREMNARRRPSTLDLTLGQPGRAADQDLIERAAADRGGYTETAGLPELRAAIAAHHRRRGPEEVLVTVGSEQAVYLALTCLVAPGTPVLYPEPGYPAYPGIILVLGGVPCPYPVRRTAGYVPSLDELAAAAPPGPCVVLWNTPSNPFGAIANRSSTEALVALAAARSWTVVSDEIYRDLRYGDDAFVGPPDLDPGAILVSGLSKSCALTGYRLGYLCGPAAFVERAALVHQLMVTCAPRIAQRVALEVFTHPERLSAHLPVYAEARTALAALSAQLPSGAELHLGPGAFYAILVVDRWTRALRSPNQPGSLALALDLLEHEDVAVVPGVAFGPSGDDFLRLSYAGGPELATAGLARIFRRLSALDR